ncbi:MAG: hypothetical protein ACFFCW_10970 [Candidatus Hodarchaeota archaeon]
MEIQYYLNNALPKLSWIATANRAEGIIYVEHGVFVECRKDWMVEGVWDGDFEKGEFHQSENFFGSGIRAEQDVIYFVPSSALVDRLLYCEYKKKIIVSNSLILLMAYTGATLDGNHDYWKESLSILKGVNYYEKEFKIIHPQIECFYQVFNENMVVSKKGIKFEKRSKAQHNIGTFEQYFELLKNILFRIKNNYEDEGRNTSFSSFTTISKGYDSTAVSSLAKDLGVRICFTGSGPLKGSLHWLRFIYNRLRRYYHSDDGTSAAKALGLEVKYLNRERSTVSQDELYFLSTNYPKFAPMQEKSLAVNGYQLNPIHHWPELSLHTMTSYLEKSCSVAVVFTGYHGDKVWETDLDKKYLADDIIRGDLSGLNITEIRLKSGFINLPVPFILALNIRDIFKISHSKEMEPWRLRNNYDRPIPRRIAESSGVNRYDFGIEKLFLANAYNLPVNRQLRKSFFVFLRRKHGITRMFVYIYFCGNQMIRIFQKILYKIKLSDSLISSYRVYFWKEFDFYFFMNHWAIHNLSEKTANIFKNKLRRFDNSLLTKE